MKDIFQNYLFQKGYLAGMEDRPAEEAFASVFALKWFFALGVSAGEAYAHPGLIRFVSAALGEKVPEPFYRGFPQSVRALPPEALLYDQLLHYFVTYGKGDFTETRHSVFETLSPRPDLAEDIKSRSVEILSPAEAEHKCRAIAADLLAGSRPLSENQYAFLLEYVKEYGMPTENCASKNTAIRLLLDLRDLAFARFLSLEDGVKVAAELNWRSYQNKDIRKLNLRNQDRKFLCALLEALLLRREPDLAACCEKKAAWCGLLHHIHYRPKTETAARFVNVMRGKENLSVYAAFEKALAAGQPAAAAALLREAKGPGAVLRRLDQLISLCETEEDAQAVLGCADTENATLLIQLYLHCMQPELFRVFVFTRFNQLCIHAETEAERQRRKTLLPPGKQRLLAESVEARLRQVLYGRLGKTYIDPAMRRVALPLQEASSQGGLGVLPRGTRLKLPAGKKLRAFVYWEKVDDIDLSVIGLGEDGSEVEFSWRTMGENQSEAVTYSGDQTSGYHGGSEYFDIDLSEVRAKYPGLRRLVFCANVFSDSYFNECICRAGYMLRDTADSGAVFEPKTVNSAFTVNSESTFAYLFGVDLEQNDFIWLNMAKSSRAHVAGDTAFGFLSRWFDVTNVMNLYTLASMMASEIALTPADAETVVSDAPLQGLVSGEIIRSCDFERIRALMA